MKKSKKLFMTLLALLLCSFIGDNIKLEQLNNDKGLFSVVIIKNDKTVFRQFYNNKTENDLFNIQSETKSLMAILIGIAVDKGFIKNIDQALSDFFPELLTDTNAVKKQITIRHILNQTSGLKDYEWPQLDKWSNNSNPTNLVLSQSLVSIPGERYQYNTAATHILSAILTMASNMETARFADKYLFQPLGITHYKWDKLNDGYYDGGGRYCWMKTEDIAKIGSLLLHKGKLKDQQLISEQWVNQICNKENKVKAPWGLKNSFYGLCWYQSIYKGQEVYYMMGYAGQFMFIFPELKIIIAVNHNNYVYDGNQQSYNFMETFLPLIYEAVVAQKDQ